ncbi:hypothetical protein [Arcobacter cloacae]|uniref:Uncharacterized protein n=1 Tax=Arcobacter cloacae TaxID=1054034 RepID=A0A6M8N954_9BACT|nr:hypothetical protein [Arcobacter cloacae]QKF90598.1 hypothetical protein ACLO_2133 [Arcobacter cloacae]RXI37584.1 hypothetical protein CP963_12270 [Arcobacter cloacae]
MKELFDKYQKIKQNLKFDYKNYPIENIMSIDIVSLTYNKRTFRLKELAWLFMTQKVFINTDKKILFSMGPYRRKDYYELLDFVRQDINSNLIDFSKIKRSFKFSFKNIFISFKHIFTKKISLSFKSKLSLFCSMTYILNIIDDLEKNKLSKNLEKFCSFCSTHNYEAILDYYFQKNGVTTYTLQHGLYFIMNSYPIDVIAYEHMPADKLLCWGQYTKDEFIKYGISENRIEVTGYPRNIKKLNEKKVDNLKILVLFARVQYNENNLKIVELLKELSKSIKIEVEFKLHPSLNHSLYENLAKENGFYMSENKTIQELITTNNYSLSIVYNSTAYYDSYINNCITLRYKDIDADNSIDVWDDSFSNIEELKSKIEFFKEKNNEQDFWDETEKKLEYILGFGTNKYKEILDAN